MRKDLIKTLQTQNSRIKCVSISELNVRESPSKKESLQLGQDRNPKNFYFLSIDKNQESLKLSGKQ